MGSLKLNKNKILKLTNVLIKRFNGNELDIVQVEVEKMVNYLKSKGSIQVGPATITMKKEKILWNTLHCKEVV